MVALTWVTMEIDPSEQVSFKRSSPVLMSTPSNIGCVVRAESARDATLRPSTRSETWQLKRMEHPPKYILDE